MYHASPIADLHHTGLLLTVQRASVAARRPMPHTYVGTVEYIEQQYFSYVRPGTYHLYKIDCLGVPLSPLPTGGQWRTDRDIPAQQVTQVGTYTVGRDGTHSYSAVVM